METLTQNEISFWYFLLYAILRDAYGHRPAGVVDWRAGKGQTVTRSLRVAVSWLIYRNAPIRETAGKRFVDFDNLKSNGLFTIRRGLFAVMARIERIIAKFKTQTFSTISIGYLEEAENYR